MYSGGIADKIGNRFEARWLTSQLLGLLSGEAISVTIEKIGDDEQGFEFLVEKADVSVWHQCKRQTSATSWTIPALANEGVIENFAGKLGITSADRCVFVSTDVAKQIKLLEEKRRVATSLAEFESALAQNEHPYWQSLIDQLAVDGEGALDWLAHCEFHSVSEDMLEEIVAHRVAFWFAGDPDVIVSAIRAWVEEDATLNRPIDRSAFLEFIASKNFDVKQYEVDGALPGRLKERTRSYADSYSPLGAGLFRIDRRESDLLVEALLETPDVDVVALVGAAGSGKSALVRDAVSRIADKGVLQLAFRVDQVGEPLSIAQLGTAVIDVDDSPAVVLEKLSGNNRAILYIDQADAVSEMAGRSTHVRRQLLELVRQARSYEHVRLVFSCRTFDFENDAQFLDIAAGKRTVRIDVPMYDWHRDVVPVLCELGILIDDGPRIRSLLTQPIALSLAAKLAQNGSTDLRDVNTLSDLFERLIEDRDRAIRQRHSPAWSLYQVLEAVAAEMSERQELVASARVLDGFAGAKDYLQQEGLIVVAGGGISLLHESLFDHLHARSFVSGSRSLVEFLTASEQTLFRRTQVRQILAAERDLRPNRYRSDLRDLLMSDAVRVHIKDFVLRWLGTATDPTGEEWRILADYSAGRRGDDLPKSVGIVLLGQAGWFDLLSGLGLIAVWLSGAEAAQAWALSLSRSIASTKSSRLVAELNRYLDERPEQAGRLLEYLWHVGPKEPQPDLADVIIRALGMTGDVKVLRHGEGLFELNSSWVEHAPEDAARILAACFACWYRVESAGAPFKGGFDDGSTPSHHLIELAKARPLAMLDAVLPAMAVAMRRMPGEDGPPRQDQVWYWRRRDFDDAHVEFLDIVKDAFGRAAGHGLAEVGRLFDIIDPVVEITSLHLLLETVARNGEGLAPLLARHRDHPALFEAGLEGAPASSAGDALAAAWDWLDPADRKGFEERILALWPELDDTRWALSMRGPGGNADPEKTERQMRETALRYLSLSGRRQWSVLRRIGLARLSPAARDRLAFLERKFEGGKPEQPSGMHIGTASSPISIEHATRMSDDAWICAFGRVGEGERTWMGNGYRGGARELARVLQARAKEHPERFVELIGRIPVGSNPSFVNGIVMGLSEASPSPAQTERVLELVEVSNGPAPDHRGLVWLIRATKGEKGDRALGFMLRAAESPGDDTAVGEMSGSNNEKPEPVFKQALALGNHLDSRAMNSTRGAALMEIGAQSWASGEKYDRFRSFIEPFVGSDMPDFLHASLGAMLVAALKFDRLKARDWITRTAERAPTSLFTSNGRRALFSLDVNEHETCKPILIRLADSPEPLEQAVGCLLIAQRSLDDERWVVKIDELIERGPLQRAAIAEVAASYVADASHFSRASSWLIRFFDDEDEGVRRTAVDCFRRMAPDRIASHVSLYEAYVASRYFNGERSSFLHRIAKAPVSMDDVVLGLIEKTVAVAKSRATQLNLGMYQIWDPLLRIYASSVHHRDRLSRCLDIVDDMVMIDGMGSGRLNAAL